MDVPDSLQEGCVLCKVESDRYRNLTVLYGTIQNKVGQLGLGRPACAMPAQSPLYCRYIIVQGTSLSIPERCNTSYSIPFCLIHFFYIFPFLAETLISLSSSTALDTV